MKAAGAGHLPPILQPLPQLGPPRRGFPQQDTVAVVTSGGNKKAGKPFPDAVVTSGGDKKGGTGTQAERGDLFGAGDAVEAANAAADLANIIGGRGAVVVTTGGGREKARAKAKARSIRWISKKLNGLEIEIGSLKEHTSKGFARRVYDSFLREIAKARDLLSAGDTERAKTIVSDIKGRLAEFESGAVLEWDF